MGTEDPPPSSGAIGAVLNGTATGIGRLSVSWREPPSAVKLLVSFVILCVLGVPAFAIVWKIVSPEKTISTASATTNLAPQSSNSASSVVLHPGAAASFGQSGGVTAGQVMLGQPARHLDDCVREDMKSRIPIDRKVAVEVVQGDQEAFQFAAEIRDFLASQRYSIESKVKPVTCNDPVFGQTLITGSDPMVVRIGTREQPTSVDPRSILLPARAP